MIKVTLEFPNAQGVVDFFAGKAAVQNARVESPAPKTEKPAAPKVEKPGPAPAPAPKAEKPAADADSPVDYPTLQKAVFALAEKNKAVVQELITAQGGRSFKQLDPSEWVDALARVQAADAALASADAEMA